MSEKYDFKRIEEKWQSKWEETGIYRVTESSQKPKKYVLEMFPYPSGSIHMGHVRNYSIGDVIARVDRMQGFNVLHPMGYDAFGLPAENAAIEHGIHPMKWTYENIKTMHRQLKRLGVSYDWEREITTSDPEYYCWGQWLFLRFMEEGLVYRKKASVNWCPSCETVLANEQVEAGCCWRCESQVEIRQLKQWFFRITEYAQELLDDLKLLEGWPERVKLMQENWIGRSEGAMVNFELKETGEIIPVFTTRPDTLYGATFFLLAPEHPLAEKLIADTKYKPEVEKFRKELANEVEIDPTSPEVEKKGVFTGAYAINPLNGEEIPIWVANYVVMEYGTGAVMAVPAHDQRDFEFAQRYELPIRVVIHPLVETLSGDKMDQAYIGPGVMVNSGPFNGVESREGIKKVTEYLEEKGIGKFAVNYKLRDWLISRQRYWGNPIPIIYCSTCGVVPVPEEDLPVLLPEEVEIKEGRVSPLNTCEEFIDVTCPKCDGSAKRETDTMDTFTCSSWYFLRYTSPQEKNSPFDVEAANYWMPVDRYIGGIEHAVMHLLYARFFTKAIEDLGLLQYTEPFLNLLTQGMVIKDGAKMSKSRGNIVDPNYIVNKYGADTARLFILFAAPPEKDLEWSDQGVEGCFRFFNRTWRIVQKNIQFYGNVDKGVSLDQADKELLYVAHRTTKRVTEDIRDRNNFNTAIAAIMELVNAMHKYHDSKGESTLDGLVLKEATEKLLLLLAPFAPHIAEELWEKSGKGSSIHLEPWPTYNEEKAQAEEITIVVQVNGKVRDRIEVPADMDEEEMKEMALSSDRAKKYTVDKEVVKVITVPKKLINIVVK